MNSESIILPGIKLYFPGKKQTDRVLLLAGGNPPDKNWLREVAEASDIIWAVDSGADICVSTEIIPDLVIGDMDSINQDTLTWIETRKIPVERYPVEKDLTDLQLAVKKIGENYRNSGLVISGVFGGRLDHALSNLFTGVWGLKSGLKSVVLSDEKEMVTLLEGPSKLELSFSEVPKVLSLLALSEKCSGVTLKGSYWELHNQDLEIYRPYAISNRIENVSSPAVIEVNSGWLGVYVNH